MQSSEAMEGVREIEETSSGPGQGAPYDETERLLPAGFEGLEHFKEWILHTEAERNVKRLKSDYADVKAFYDAMMARQKDWASHLDRFTADSFPPAESRLYAMGLSLMEVATAVEYFQSSDLKDAVPAERVTIHEPAYTAKTGPNKINQGEPR